MGTTQRWAPLPLLAALALVVVAACGPSDEEIAADVDEICAGMIADLEELSPEPGFGLLPVVAGDASHEFGAAAFRVEDVASEGRDDPLAIALHDVSDAYRDIERQITKREYGLLVDTRRTGEAALAAAIEAAREMGATGCLGLDLRSGYFAVGAEGAAEAAAAIAPTGDYVADVDASCVRYDEDVFAVMFELNLEAIVLGATDGEMDAGDYIDTVEDLLVIEIALGTLVRELEAIPPPPGLADDHAELVAGFADAKDAFGRLGNGGPVEPLVASAARVDAAAARLGVTCKV